MQLAPLLPPVPLRPPLQVHEKRDSYMFLLLWKYLAPKRHLGARGQLGHGGATAHHRVSVAQSPASSLPPYRPSRALTTSKIWKYDSANSANAKEVRLSLRPADLSQLVERVFYPAKRMRQQLLRRSSGQWFGSDCGARVVRGDCRAAGPDKVCCFSTAACNLANLALTLYTDRVGGDA
jgi:hypothetical protein